MSLFTVIPQGPFLSQTAENNCPYHRVVGFLILSGQFIITVVVHIVFWYDGVQSSDVLKVRPVALVSRATAETSKSNLLPRSHRSLMSFASIAWHTCCAKEEHCFQMTRTSRDKSNVAKVCAYHCACYAQCQCRQPRTLHFHSTHRKHSRPHTPHTHRGLRSQPCSHTATVSHATHSPLLEFRNTFLAFPHSLSPKLHFLLHRPLKPRIMEAFLLLSRRCTSWLALPISLCLWGGVPLVT